MVNVINLQVNRPIYINRGDDYLFPLEINRGTALHPDPFNWEAVYADKSKVFFGVMEPNDPFEKCLIKKVYTKDNKNLNEDGNLTIRINSLDTARLMPGTYYYEVKLLMVNPYGLESGEEPDELLLTVIPKTKFIIVE